MQDVKDSRHTREPIADVGRRHETGPAAGEGIRADPTNGSRPQLGSWWEALLRSRKEEGKVKSRFLPGLEVSITCMKVDVKVVGDIADSSQRIAHPYCKP